MQTVFGASMQLQLDDPFYYLNNFHKALNWLQQRHADLLLAVTGHDAQPRRAARKAALAELGLEACERVKKTGEAVALESMNPFERKVVHDAVGEAGLKSESEGEEPNRYVVVLPA